MEVGEGEDDDEKSKTRGECGEIAIRSSDTIRRGVPRATQHFALLLH